MSLVFSYSATIFLFPIDGQFIFFNFFYLLMFIYLERVSGGEGQKDRERNPKQAVAVSTEPNPGSIL